ncbi:MAG: Crp/Fnr family transcriptional regulator [Solirubrobacteraceae bacterium]
MRLSPVHLLDEDPTLLRAIPELEQPPARQALVANAGRVPRGAWRPLATFRGQDIQFGLLILEGLLIRDVVVAHTTCGELIGPGELLRPGDNFGDRAPMPFEVEWKVIEPTFVAALGSDFTRVVTRWPDLVNVFIDRAVERSHSLALHVAIHCIRRVDLSLLVLFWHLADRFGKVTSDGIVVSVKLTHQDLGKLVGATRQSVTAALGEVAERGWVTRGPNGSWLLPADPPREIQAMLGRRRGRDET